MKNNKTKVIFAITLVVIILTGFLLRSQGYFSQESISTFLESHNVSAPCLFIFIYIVAPSLFFPALPLNLIAGFLWGPYWGTLFALLGSILGSSLTFLIGRYLAYDFCKKAFDYNRWNWILSKMDRHGWKIVAFVKINPLFPSNVFSYLFGITSIRFTTFFFISCLFSFPSTLAVSILGNTMKDCLLVNSLKVIVSGITLSMLLLIGLQFIKKWFHHLQEGKLNETASK